MGQLSDGDYQVFGALMAVNAGLRAILRTIPITPELLEAIDREYESALATLLQRPIPEAAIEAFRGQFASVRLAVGKAQE